MLPTTFANRQAAGGVAVGTSPFGQPYAIRAIRRPGSILTFVVFDSGTAMPGPITKTGYNTTTDSLTTLKGHVASEISKHYQIPTGIIRQGETTVRGGFNGFTMNVSAYVGSGVTQPTAIVLKGFPELESDGGDGGEEPSGGYSGTCNIVWGYYRVIATNTYQYYSPTCPSNAEEVDRFSACTEGVRVRNTPVGLALTIAPNHSESQTTRKCNYGEFQDYTLTSTTNYESVYVNAAEISNNEAGGFVTHCGFVQENLRQIAPACQVYETGLPSVRDVAASAGQNAEAILCCVEE